MEQNFYTFEMEDCGGNFVKVRKILNGNCFYEGTCKWLSVEEKKIIRNGLMKESFYLNYQKKGFPKIFNINGFEIVKEERNFIIKYLISGIKLTQSAYDLSRIDLEKEKTIINMLSNLCLNNLEAENQGHSLIFMINEVERIVFGY